MSSAWCSLAVRGMAFGGVSCGFRSVSTHNASGGSVAQLASLLGAAARLYQQPLYEDG